jgi:hypothetical protein
MKLLRYGQSGEEKPGLLDADGAIRDLSAILRISRLIRSQSKASRN